MSKNKKWSATAKDAKKLNFKLHDIASAVRLNFIGLRHRYCVLIENIVQGRCL